MLETVSAPKTILNAPPGLPAATETLASVIAELKPERRAEWAWENYRNTVLALSRAFGLHRLCEIGGGRDPLFTPSEAEELGIDFTINDISSHELARAAPRFRKECFDIAGNLAGISGERYDLMFSRMVFEHVKDVERAWRNVHTLLRPGGVALAFFPTLWALPFAFNYLVPEWMSSAVVKAL